MYVTLWCVQHAKVVLLGKQLLSWKQEAVSGIAEVGE
jgi:hypothetical protein